MNLVNESGKVKLLQNFATTGRSSLGTFLAIDRKVEEGSELKLLKLDLIMGSELAVRFGRDMHFSNLIVREEDKGDDSSL